jgi:DNA-binding NarL/FixJ family response regulator
MKIAGKVLVVDDEAHIRKFVTVLIESLATCPGILQAANGGEAIEIYEREKPALVLLDVNMPRVDGLQTLRRLKEADPGCTVVMLTSLVNRQTVEECLRLGAVGYLRKDNPPEEMTRQLKKIIGDCFGIPPGKRSKVPFPSPQEKGAAP